MSEYFLSERELFTRRLSFDRCWEICDSASRAGSTFANYKIKTESIRSSTVSDQTVQTVLCQLSRRSQDKIRQNGRRRQLRFVIKFRYTAAWPPRSSEYNKQLGETRSKFVSIRGGRASIEWLSLYIKFPHRNCLAKVRDWLLLRDHFSPGTLLSE